MRDSLGRIRTPRIDLWLPPFRLNQLSRTTGRRYAGALSLLTKPLLNLASPPTAPPPPSHASRPIRYRPQKETAPRARTGGMAHSNAADTASHSSVVLSSPSFRHLPMPKSAIMPISASFSTMLVGYTN